MKGHRLCVHNAAYQTLWPGPMISGSIRAGKDRQARHWDQPQSARRDKETLRIEDVG
jgi:hypothetical protein